MVLYALAFSAIIVILALVLGVKKQGRVTQSFSAAEQSQNAKVFEESTERMEATVAEKLAEKARDPRLASMTQEDLVYEILKECYDPEIPLNVVDLGLVYDVKVHTDTVNVKITMTSPMCPSHVAISEGGVAAVDVTVGWKVVPEHTTIEVVPEAWPPRGSKR